MGSQQSLANQLGWCITTKDHLNEIIRHMDYLTSRYKEHVESLEDNNFMDEYLKDVKKMQEDFESRVKKMKNHINDVHLDYIQDQTDTVKDHLNSFTSYNNG